MDILPVYGLDLDQRAEELASQAKRELLALAELEDHFKNRRMKRLVKRAQSRFEDVLQILETKAPDTRRTVIASAELMLQVGLAKRQELEKTYRTFGSNAIAIS